MQPLAIINNEKEQQFQVMVDGQKAYLEYRMHNGVMTLIHTEVPEKLSGKGIASGLAAFALDHARRQRLPVKVYCPFVSSWLQRHPEYLDIVIPREKQ